MTGLTWALDGGFALLLVVLVTRAMLTRDLFEAVVLFIAFGLTLSLAWVRLGAPDVALAEAALGAGVTGALFLNAFQRLARASADSDLPHAYLIDDEPGVRSLRLRAISVGTAAFLAAAFVGVLVGIPAREAVLAEAVNTSLPRTGLSNPVTAVLLSFRAYDTLFEVAVLVLATVTVWSLDREHTPFHQTPGPRGDPVLEGLTSLVVPVAGVTAVYLVWAGTHAAGGAFQGGALLAGIGVLLAASGVIRPGAFGAPVIRVLGLMGLALFIGVGVVFMPWTGSLLTYPEGWDYAITLAVEGTLALSVAVILVELFLDVPAAPEADPRFDRVDPTGDPLGRKLRWDSSRTRRPGEDG
ncbi:MAG: hydrogen gas-evolving membrane-bound hydrogenase subunit E [Gemmatimonadota bacterium]|nr:hydrogen gas-evolving membrane-bound hydrogenase subunit E [Gemmatimonadota bacterium]